MVFEGGDVGRIARSARRLEMIGYESLVVLSLVQNAVKNICDIKSKDKLHRVSPNHVIGLPSYGNRDPALAVQGFYDLEWRGILTRAEGMILANGPRTTSYRLTEAFYEIIDAVDETC
jgi:hypothetical protein